MFIITVFTFREKTKKKMFDNDNWAEHKDSYLADDFCTASGYPVNGKGNGQYVYIYKVMQSISIYKKDIQHSIKQKLKKQGNYIFNLGMLIINCTLRY